MSIPKEPGFPLEEFEVRQAGVRAAMEAHEIDTLIVHSAPNIYYLCGHNSLNLWDYQCLVLPLEGTPFMVLWQFEHGRFETSSAGAGVELFETGADPVEATMKALNKHGLVKGTIGLEVEGRYLSPFQHHQLLDALESTDVVNGSRLVDLVRNVKTAREIALLRKVAAANDLAMEVGIAAVREGVLDSEVAAAVAHSLISSGSLAFAIQPIVAAGYRAGMPHNTNIGKRIERGETVFLEFSPTLHWYNTPLMRTVAVGPPSDKVRDFADLARATVEAMLAKIGPGVPASEVAETAKASIARVRSEIMFHEVYGYPVGIGMPPTWVEESGFFIMVDNHRPLPAGMVFHIPMTLRLNGRLGVGMSYTVLVTETGNEPLSKLPLELRVVE